MNINRKLVILILITSFVLIAAGLTCGPSLGDEVYHYRFAKDIFNLGKRAAFDPLYGSGNPPGYFYSSEPLWHMLLASLWKLFGNIYFPVAQFYHTVYYVMLVLFTYLLGKELYGQKQGLYSALIVATVPVVAAFSVLFYLDIPATSLSTLCLFLIIKRKYLWSGIVLGLMYLTKRNTCFFVPGFLFLIFYQTETGFKEKIKNCIYFLVPTLLFIIPDFLWRENNLKSTVMINGQEVVMSSSASGTFEGVIRRVTLADWHLLTREYLNSSLFNPIDIIKYLGIVLLIALALYVIYKRYEKKDLKLWVPILCYFLFFCYIFNPGSDIRYIIPIVPFLVVLSSKVIECFKVKWLSYIIIFLCFSQFIGTVLFVRINRQIPKEIEEGFAYLKNNTSDDALVIYPEYIMIEKTNRRFAWAGNLHEVLQSLFRSKDDNKIKDSLKSFNVNFIAIKKSRVYDDCKVQHFGGYPKSFIERLPSFSFVKLVFDNKEMSIWKVE